MLSTQLLMVTANIFMHVLPYGSPTMVCHLVVVVGLMHRWPRRFLIWRRGANQAQTAW